MTADELFDEWERAWSGRDPARFEPLCAEGFQYEDPLTPEPLRGSGALARHAQRLWAAFPDARVNATGPRLAGGGFACAPCELRGGRLLRARAFFDVHEAGMQLGVFPRPGTAGQRALLVLRGFGLRNT